MQPPDCGAGLEHPLKRFTIPHNTDSTLDAEFLRNWLNS